MANNVFISFRYVDGIRYKDALANLFDQHTDTVDFSEDEDRSQLSDEAIRQYLYSKLRKSSVTIVLLTPQAVHHKRDYFGRYDDWMYDEIRYSLENRYSNRTNGLIAVYTPEAAKMLVSAGANGTVSVNNVDNLFRRNMMNIKPVYKKNQNPGIYDRDYDSYCSLVSWSEFTNNVSHFITIADWKRNNTYRYDLVKRI